MAAKILDSYSLLSYLEGTQQAQDIIKLIKAARDNERDLLISSVSWGEVLLLIAKELGLEKVAVAENMLETLPIAIVPADQTLARQAAIYAATKQLPYTTCFAVALAKLRKAELVTGDKKIKQMAGEIRIRWLQ